ncbi:MAG: alpha/beta fold hydrolase [Anaerolineae bacterium]|nr:alpha/beta fold hydrolase [Anaerolineae bacterium]
MSHIVRPASFQGPLGTLRGMLHLPDRPSIDDAPVPGIIMLHGFTGHHIEDGRLFVQAARHLAAAGFAVLRFDFYGSGDSDGNFDEWTMDTQIADAVAALDWFGALPEVDAERIGMIGLSRGGATLARLVGQDTRPKAITFWNAVSLPELHEARRREFRANGGLLASGLRVGQAFLDTFYGTDIVGSLRAYTGPGLVIRGTADAVIAESEALALLAALGARGVLRTIAGANHTFQHPDWRAELFAITTEFMRAHLM